VPTTELVFTHWYDLPVAIVWDALVDEVLVEGWLAVARIDPRVGGQYWLDWQSGRAGAPTTGTVTTFEPPGRLVIKTDNIGSLDFTLESVPGGTRGTSTDLRLLVRQDIEPRLLALTHANWQSSLDQLEDLLRGHPVDWSTWQSDRGEAWATYQREAPRAN
jgi:uncharacterized protein YndB with AHSA1/START domain